MHPAPAGPRWRPFRRWSPPVVLTARPPVRRGERRGARWARRKRPASPAARPPGAPPRSPGSGHVPGVFRPALVGAERAQSVVVVGPTQSGKTTALAVPAILDWEGPVVAASVKSDLLRDTQAAGATSAAASGASIPPEPPGRVPSTWSPLTSCGEWDAARHMAADLAESAKADGTTADGEFWYATAAKLLAPLLFAAAVDGRSDGRRPALGRHAGGRARCPAFSNRRESPNRWTPPGPRGAATSAPAARSTPPRRRSWPRSPMAATPR